MHPVAHRVFRAAAPALAYRYIRLLHLAMYRREFRNLEALARSRREAGGYIMAFWHSRFVMMPYIYPDRRLVVLLSRHRDAQMLGRVLERFRMDVAWGSSTAGGVTGLRAVLRSIASGCDIALAPDGPRGPRRRVKPGVIAIARLSGIPIVPTAFSARRARRLRSWDRTLVPKLFTRGLWVCGEPLWVPRDADPREQERLRALLEQRLDRLTDETDSAAGCGPEEPRPPADGGAPAG